MTVPNWLLNHPANKLATECLKALKVPRDPATLPLLQLATEYLKRAKPKTFPWPEYQAELREQVEQLQGQNPERVARLLVPEYERFESELEGLSAPQRQRVLTEHLDQLLPSLTKQPSVLAAGQVLAENLFLALASDLLQG